MKLSDHLSELLANALSTMLKNEHNDLPLGFRRAIWAALGDNENSFKRRINLATKTVKHVLPIWDQYDTPSQLPHDLLETIKGVRNETISSDKAWEIYHNSWDSLVEMSSGEDVPIEPAAVGFAVVRALAVALKDDDFMGDKIDLELTDSEVDPDELDTSFFAASAYSGGAVWNPESDKNKRKEFWEWWLKKAVPDAWHSIDIGE